MAVPSADPAALQLDQAFAAAMAGPAKPRTVPTPPDVDDAAPFGRGEDGEPLAPHGFNKNGSVRRSAAGRKGKSEARTAEPAEPDKPAEPAGALPAKDYTESLNQTSEAAWLVLTGISMAPLGRVPVLSAVPWGKDRDGQPRKLGALLDGLGDKLGAQAAIFDQNRAGLVGALNIAANNNARARRFAERLETGDATWVLVSAAMVMPFVHQSAALWSGELDQPGQITAARLAQDNREHMQAWTQRLTATLAAAAAGEADRITQNGGQPA